MPLKMGYEIMTCQSKSWTGKKKKKGKEEIDMSQTKREEGRGRERERFIETDNWGLKIGTAMHCETH